MSTVEDKTVQIDEKGRYIDEHDMGVKLTNCYCEFCNYQHSHPTHNSRRRLEETQVGYKGFLYEIRDLDDRRLGRVFRRMRKEFAELPLDYVGNVEVN